MKKTKPEGPKGRKASRKETLDLLSKPEWKEAIRRGKNEVKNQVRGTSLRDLAD